mgnify:CR=1 FL=1
MTCSMREIRRTLPTVLLAVVSGIYFWRAKTEEWHLSADPDYVSYWQWMERNGPVPLFFRWLSGRPINAGVPVASKARP